MKVTNVFLSFRLRPLYPHERTPIPNEWEAVWAPERVRTFWKRIKFLALMGIVAGIAQSV
jgi:hypothetical protein